MDEKKTQTIEVKEKPLKTRISSQELDTVKDVIPEGILKKTPAERIEDVMTFIAKRIVSNGNKNQE